MTEPVLVEVERSGLVESVHRGSLVITAPDGSVTHAVGDASSPVFPRSSTKPLQGAGMLRAGLGYDGADLALACGSHSGEPGHVERVAAMLAAAGLDESALTCPAAYPLNETSLHAAAEPLRVTMNCSGKHAAMLATCVAAGWPTEGYEQPDHPLQKAIAETVVDLTGEPIATTGVDGCGAPLFAYSLTGLARAFGRLVQAETGSAELRVADAMRAHPWLVAGTDREDTVLMGAVPGLLSKIGAEGVLAFALADGTAVALKMSDGAKRGCAPLAVAVLAHLGADVADLDELARPPVLGGGRPVGHLRVSWSAP
ncbi:asparaginase [Amycolatopsis sp. FDAARGOS 1241]|uniref:asparaginase n=1 Tax=Amycolatopsis sp. FDAARGOS 1241 TaxID=2778070 RepID=UPI00194E8102|nr:asparaginase [Amycolatopsis sp. FDAARGOS 1241]QRP46368.1 asparaginase [Amycolatopsis sp. FDAARGOS 1241]